MQEANGEAVSFSGRLINESERLNNSPDGFNHLQTHVDAVVGVIGPRNWQTAHAVVAVAENLNTHALVFLEMYKTHTN